MSATMKILYDHTSEIADRLPDATEAGLKAGAYVYYDEVKRALAGGYTSGDFVTGRSMNSVTVSDVTWDEDVATIRVGTDLDYPLFWEFGHHNIFTRKYERVQIWQPALDVMQEEMLDVYRGTLLSYLVQGAPE